MGAAVSQRRSRTRWWPLSRVLASSLAAEVDPTVGEHGVLFHPVPACEILQGRGVAERTDPDPVNAFNRMARKYLGQGVYPWHRPEDERVVIVVRPERTAHMG